MCMSFPPFSRKFTFVYTYRLSNCISVLATSTNVHAHIYYYYTLCIPVPILQQWLCIIIVNEREKYCFVYSYEESEYKLCIELYPTTHSALSLAKRVMTLISSLSLSLSSITHELFCPKLQTNTHALRTHTRTRTHSWNTDPAYNGSTFMLAQHSCHLGNVPRFAQSVLQDNGPSGEESAVGRTTHSRKRSFSRRLSWKRWKKGKVSFLVRLILRQIHQVGDG